MKPSDEDVDEQMLIAYRHDEHKTRGGSHAAGVRHIDGVPVNEEVPYGADRAAGEMSRPSGKPKQSMPTGEETHYRRSLITGEAAYDPSEISLQRLEPQLNDLFTMQDADALHRAWLQSDVLAQFNESVYYPYTSLKYHTLLVAALLDNFRNGFEYSGLSLHLTDTVFPHKTVFDGGDWYLTIAPTNPTAKVNPDSNDIKLLKDWPHARLGAYPQQRWANVWSRMTQHPLDPTVREDQVLDANLRRIRSWSVALQYLEDYRSGEWSV